MEQKYPCPAAFGGTEEQKQKLTEVIEKYKGAENALLSVMQEAQGIFGCLSEEVRQIIADRMNVSPEKLESIATLYSQFELQPRAKYRIDVCIGTACYVSGGGEILNKFCKTLGIKEGECTPDGMFSVNASHCLGKCKTAPTVCVNGEAYSNFKTGDVEKLIAKCRKNEKQ